MSGVGPVHYRYCTSYDGVGIEVSEERWLVVKETPAGYWIRPEQGFGWGIKENDKFVLKQSRRRFAYTTRQEAWESFCIRRRRYAKLLEWRYMANRELVAVLPTEVPALGSCKAGTMGEFEVYNTQSVCRGTIPDEDIARHYNIPVESLNKLLTY